MSIQPIKPSDVASQKPDALPSDVIDEWNRIIVESWDGSRAHVKQSQVIERLMARTGVKRSDVFERHWLDVEPLFRAMGWDVEFEKPGYNETYEATFTFREARP